MTHAERMAVLDNLLGRPGLHIDERTALREAIWLLERTGSPRTGDLPKTFTWGDIKLMVPQERT